MTFTTVLALLALHKSCASTNNEDVTSFVQRGLTSVSKLSNVTKLYQSTVSGDSTRTPAVAQCRAPDGNFTITGKGYLFPYLDGKYVCTGDTNYCIAECPDAVYKADLDECNASSADTQGCNLQGNLSALFIDFDGTLELYDDLADDVNELLPTEIGLSAEEYAQKKLDDPQGANPTNQVTGAKMIAALEKVFATKCNSDTDTFLKMYFQNPAAWGKPNRLEKLSKALTFFRDNGVKTYVMSASWAPIGAGAWAEYLKNLTTDAKYGLHLSDKFDGILTVADPGGKTPGNKAVKIAEVMTSLNKTMAFAVHIDNSYKYMQQVVHGGRMVGKAGAARAGGVSPIMHSTGVRSQGTREVNIAGVQCSHFKLIAAERSVPGFNLC
jgi:hypothetical protein